MSGHRCNYATLSMGSSVVMVYDMGYGGGGPAPYPQADYDVCKIGFPTKTLASPPTRSPRPTPPTRPPRTTLLKRNQNYWIMRKGHGWSPETRSSILGTVERDYDALWTNDSGGNDAA